MAIIGFFQSGVPGRHEGTNEAFLRGVEKGRADNDAVRMSPWLLRRERAPKVIEGQASGSFLIKKAPMQQNQRDLRLLGLHNYV